MDTLLHDLELFYEMLNSCHNLFLYQYDANMQFRSGSGVDSSVPQTLFEADNNPEFIAGFAKGHHNPLILMNDIGMTWIIVLRKESSEPQGIFVLGPIFTEDFSIPNIKEKLQQKGVSLALCAELIKVLKELPVLSIIKCLEYAVMFHYCVNREAIHIHNVHFKDNTGTQQADTPLADSHGTWAVENALLQMVTDGNLNYQKEMNKLVTSGRSGKLSNNDFIRQSKNQVIIFISLCCRAAVKGGMNIELAYALSDRYIQSVESAKTMGECNEINSTMLEDYVNRVHKCRTTHISVPIKAVCDYLDLNLDRNPSLDEIASFANYSKYYLSRKFKKEIGKNITDYMNEIRIERSKKFLTGTTLDIQTIGERFGFCSPSYFSECFRKYARCTPAEFRDGKMNSDTLSVL